MAVVFVWLLLLATLFALEISKDTIQKSDKPINLANEPLVIKPNVMWSLFTESEVVCLDVNIGENAKWYVSGPTMGDPLVVASKQGTFINKGVTSFYAETIVRAMLQTLKFLNEGQMYFGSPTMLTGSKALVVGADLFINKGLMYFLKLKEIGIAGSGFAAKNEGDIFFVDSLVLANGIAGTGCLHIVGNSMLERQTNRFRSTPDLTVLQFATDSTGVVWTGRNEIIRGFGKGMTLVCIVGCQSFKYDGQKLTVADYGGDTLIWDIGPGYDKSLFQIRNRMFQGLDIGSRNGIIYNGPVPAAAAWKPNCAQLPKWPIEHPKSASSSSLSAYTLSTTTLSSSSLVTSATTLSSSSLSSSATTLSSSTLSSSATTLSSSTLSSSANTLPSSTLSSATTLSTSSTVASTLSTVTSCDGCTAMTTQWTTTDDQGKGVTDSGVVFVTTNTDNKLVTSTSVYPRPSSAGCVGCTKFSTTWSTTDNKGATVTESGEVVVTTDSEGKLTTSTGTLPRPSPTTCSDCTEYTKTWSVTDENGAVATDSGVVLVTTDSDQKLTTKTSIIPRPIPSAFVCTDCTEYTTTWMITDNNGAVATDSGLVLVTTDADKKLTTITSIIARPTSTGCADCTEYNKTWTFTDENGVVATDSGLVMVTTDSDQKLTTKTSVMPRPTGTDCTECSEYSTMWTITDDKGNVATDSGLVVVTTDSDKKLVTATSVFPRPDPGCPECTEYTQTWMITDDKGVVATDSGVVKVTTDSGKNLVTLTSLIPRPSDPGCSECTEFTQTWTFTDDLGVVATDSGVVLVTTDSDRKVVTATSLIPRPSEPGCPDCSEYTTTWTVTAENGQVGTDSGVVVVTTDSENKLTTKTSVIARPSDSGCAECTEFTLTWSFTDSNGVVATDSGVVVVTTDSENKLTTKTSVIARPSDSGCAECTEFTLTWSLTDSNGVVATDSGLVVVTTGDDKKLTTKTSVIPRPSDQGCPDCTEYTLTWTLTNDQGDVTTASGIVLVTTDSDKSLVTKTSLLPSPSRSGCPECTEETRTWTLTNDEGVVATETGVVLVTTDSDGKLTTTTSIFTPSSSVGCVGCSEYTQSWTITDSMGVVATDSGVVIVTTDSDQKLTTMTSVLPRPSNPSCPDCTEFTLTWTSTNDEGIVASATGVVIVSTDSNGSLFTLTSLLSQATNSSCPECTEYTQTWFITDDNGAVATDSGVVAVTTDSEGKLITSTSVIARPSNPGCPECTEYTQTWSITDDNGVVATDSGVVVVTTDADNKLVTKTSVLARPSQTGCPECTEYTLTWTTTNDNGAVTTDSGVVVVTTDSEKNLVTQTSTIARSSDGSCSGCFEYTQTWTVTDDNGGVTTESGVVAITTDAENKWTTTTSKIPPSIDPGCPDCTEYSLTWSYTDGSGLTRTRSGVVVVTTDSDKKLYTLTSTVAVDSRCPDCFEYTLTWTFVDGNGELATDSGVIVVTTASDEKWTTVTSVLPRPSDPGCPDCTEYTQTWTTTDSQGQVGTSSGVVVVTTDADKKLTTMTSGFAPPDPECPECTEYTQTWSFTDQDGNVATDSGVVLVTTDSAKQLTTATSVIARPSNLGCSGCTEFTQTWSFTDGNGVAVTDSGVVVVTTDTDGKLTTATSIIERPSDVGCSGCTEYTLTWSTTDANGVVAANSGVILVTTGSDKQLTTVTSTIAQSSDPSCSGCTEYTLVWTSTNDDGSTVTDSAVVIVTTNSDRLLTTMSSALPRSSASVCSDCTEFSLTWTSTDSNGGVATDSGVVIVSTDSNGSLYTLTSLAPQPSDSGCSGCTEYTLTWSTTDANGVVAANSGVILVTTGSDKQLTTVTSTIAQSSDPSCSGCTEYTLVWTSTNDDGSTVTDSAVVIVTTNSDRLLTTMSSALPRSSASVCSDCTEFTLTWTSTDSSGSVATDSGVVIVSTDSNGSLYTLTSLVPRPSDSGCSGCTEYTLTWSTTDANGVVAANSGVILVTTGSDKQLTTVTSTIAQSSDPSCSGCTEYTLVWTSTNDDGSTVTDSAVVIVTTNSDRLLTTMSSALPRSSASVCSDCTEFTLTWTSTDSSGSVATDSGVVVVSTDSNGSLYTLTSLVPRPSDSGCSGCTEYTLTWSTTDANGIVASNSGVILVTTGSDKQLTTVTSTIAQSSDPGCSGCTEYTLVWTSTNDDGSTVTDSAVVIVTTNSDRLLTTMTSALPRSSASVCSDCTEFSLTWTSTDTSGSVATDSGVVVVSTDSNWSLYTLTSLVPRPSDSGCPQCSEYTQTWQITDDQGVVATDSGLVVVTTDANKLLTTMTSVIPRTSNTDCSGCTEFTQTWTVTDDTGAVATDSGVVMVTTDSVGSLVTMTSVIARPSDPGCPECTQYTQTWSFTDDKGNVATDSGVVYVTTDFEKNVVTMTSIIPRPSGPACAECTEYTQTWTVTDERGEVATDSGLVIVTTDAEKNLVTVTSVIARPSDPGCSECSQFTQTWTVTDDNGNVATDSGVVIVTTDSEKRLTTMTSVIARPSNPGCPECTEFTSEWTSTAEDGSLTTLAGVVRVTTDNIGSLVTSTSLIPNAIGGGVTLQTSSDSSAVESVTTWTTTDTEGSSSTGSGIVDVTTDSEGSETTSTSTLPETSESSSIDESVTTWTTTDTEGSTSTGSGIVDVTTDSEGSETTTTSTLPELSNGSSSDESVTTWTSTDTEGSTSVGSGIVDVTTDSEGSETTTTSTLPESSGTSSTDESVTTWTSTDSEGSTSTGSGIVDVTTDSEGSETTSTSTLPESSDNSSADESVTTWTTTDTEGSTSTGSGIVDVTTDSEGSETTSTSTLPETSESSSADESVTTWTSTDSEGSTSTGSGIVDVTTDSEGSETTSTSTLPESSDNSSADESVTTWTTTDTEGSTSTGSGIVDVTTDSEGSETTSTSTLPETSESSSADESVTTWTSTDSEGSTSTGSGIVDVITDSEGSETTTTSTLPESSNGSDGSVTTWTTTDTEGSTSTGSGIVDVTTDSEGSETTSTSLLPETSEPSSIEESVTTWTSTDTEGSTSIGSGIVDVTTDSEGSETTSTSTLPESSNGSDGSVTTWTSTDTEGSTSVGSGIVDVTTDSEGSETTSTSTLPETSEPSSIEESVTTWTTTDTEGSTSTGSGIVDVTTDSEGSETTSTSTLPETSEPSSTEESVTTWTSTDTEGSTSVGSGIVDVTTDSEGSETTSTSTIPESSGDGVEGGINASTNSEVHSWTTTDTDGNLSTGSGIVDVTTDSDGSLVTSTSTIPDASVTTTLPTSMPPVAILTTWTTVDAQGKTLIHSGIVAVTTDSAGLASTSTSTFPDTAATVLESGVENTVEPTTTGSDQSLKSSDSTIVTTWTTTGTDGQLLTGSGIVDVTTDTDGSLTTSTSTFPSGVLTTWTTTDSNGNLLTGSGIVAVITDTHGSLTTSTSTIPGSSSTDDKATTWTTTGTDGQLLTGSGIVDVTTDTDGSLTTSTSTIPDASSTDDKATTWTTTGTDGNLLTGSGIVDVTTDTDGSLTTSTSTFPSGVLTTWTTTDSNGNLLTGSGIVAVTTDANGSLTTSTSTFPAGSLTTWTTTDPKGSTTTGSGIVDVTTATLVSTSTLSPESATTWTTTDPTGGVLTNSGIVDRTKGLTSTFSRATGETTTWVTTDPTGGVVTNTGIVDRTKGLTSVLPLETGTVSTWTTTGSDGTSATYSGIVDRTGGVISTLPTTPVEPTTTPVEPTTWTTTDSKGSSATYSGIVDRTGGVTSTFATRTPTSWVTTDSRGSSVTRSGIVDVVTDTDGVVATTTYVAPSTVTYPTTKDGKPTTQTGIVEVVTNSDGKVSTRTRELCVLCSQATTMVTTTGTDGKTTTAKGIVDVTTDEKGGLVSTTSVVTNAPNPLEHPVSGVTTDASGNVVTVHPGSVAVTTVTSQPTGGSSAAPSILSEASATNNSVSKLSALVLLVSVLFA